MADVHKQHEVKHAEKPEEEIALPDVVIETTEQIEVIEEVSAANVPTMDPLTEFKEKMTEEELPEFDNSQKKNFMWPILFIFIIAIVLLTGVFIYKQDMNKGEKVNVVTLSPTPTAIPEPTAILADLSKYEIEVLNGSEVNGEAGRQKTNLEEEGFTVSSVGNADNSDYTDTVIQAKKEVGKAFLDKLKSVLELSFVVSDLEELPEDEDQDVIVIIGSEIK